ncbi:MAG: hypothetical protein IJX25_03235 [Clostridia bacterium]|nr:hypothetical protein [Clostridia bacterium]MBQ8792527.1 hypothetical protein [Clostridia bacterium]
MENFKKNLIKFARLYSMDFSSPESLQTLYNVLIRENKRHHNSDIIPAIKAMSEKAYRNFIDYIQTNGYFEDVWLFDIYRNAPDEEAKPILDKEYSISVEEFNEEDLSFIK